MRSIEHSTASNISLMVDASEHWKAAKPSKMSSKVKITYFDLRARGELARLVMAAAKKDFEDVRVQFADWPKLKANSTYGTLPVLEIGGKEYFQGNAIATYLARENG
ncbi:glutathione S-transferase [Elysia marginata]|uniref:Glutathione S-transferase n=1 Tax=Elysia marginata TaxID=1093978 RepID=A0AAV4GKV1_9GAST|nr:glutathione S-transferase [Elysia marginata]